MLLFIKENKNRYVLVFFIFVKMQIKNIFKMKTIQVHNVWSKIDKHYH